MDGLTERSSPPEVAESEIERLERSLDESAEDLRAGRVEDAHAALDRLQTRLDRHFGRAQPAPIPYEG